jgi:hypothetical protein
MKEKNWPFPRPENEIAEYTAYRVSERPVIDGRLDEAAWRQAPKSPPFRDLVSGDSVIHETRAAVLWDDRFLYVGYWIEEPFVEARLSERDSLIWQENDVELFIAGDNAYYEFEVNALGTVYEAFFVWEDAYEKHGFAREPEFARDAPGARPWNGVGFTTHPRGPRIGFFQWDFPGSQCAVAVNGSLNVNTDRDRGWTVELALPWKGMDAIFKGDDRSRPPRDGDLWRMDFSRFNGYKEAPPSRDSGGWVWSPHGIWDSHIPELFTKVFFSTKHVSEISILK